MSAVRSEWLLPAPPPRLLQTTASHFSVASRPSLLPLRRCAVPCSVKSSLPPGVLETSQDDLRSLHLPTSRPTSGSADGPRPSTSASEANDTVASQYYQSRTTAGFRPDQTTLRLLIWYLVKSKDWNSIVALADDMVTFGVCPSRFVCVKLIDTCVKARQFRVTDVLLATFEKTDGDGGLVIAGFGSALRAYNKLHMYTTTLRLYDRMVVGGIPPDAVCYCSAMEAHRKLGDSTRVGELFRELRSSHRGLEISPRLLSEAYLILCDSFGRSGRAFEALTFFREMTEEGVPPTPRFYSSLIGAFTAVKEAEIAWDLYLEAKEKQMVKHPSIFFKLVVAYVEVGMVKKTMEVVREMKEMGFPVSDCVLSAVVNGHGRNRGGGVGLRESVEAYEEVVEMGCAPGQVTYSSMINVYSRLGLVAKAEEVFGEMVGKGFGRCVVAYGNMISMYGKAGRVSDATRLLAKMKESGCEPNVWVYNALLDMHGRAGKLRQVEKLWKEMRRRRILPDRVTYSSMIGAYSKAREMEECVHYFREFRMNGGKMDRTIAGLMVGVFSKTSKPDELIKLLQDCKMEGLQLDGRLYTSTLNALRDMGLQTQASWFQESFAHARPPPPPRPLRPEVEDG